jgi:hypothetical protein
MPFIWRDKKGEPRFTSIATLTKMSLSELEAYEAFLWECMKKLPNSPRIITVLNAIHREVEWRAQDPLFR